MYNNYATFRENNENEEEPLLNENGNKNIFTIVYLLL